MRELNYTLNVDHYSPSVLDCKALKHDIVSLLVQWEMRPSSFFSITSSKEAGKSEK